MSITANLIDQHGEIITDTHMIDHPIQDDANFEAVERAAKTYARTHNVPVAIQWVRSDDGQVAHWGPAGARFRPHYYRSA